jgi:hypothetical protein
MKRLFVQKAGLEAMVDAICKIEGASREQALKELNALLKDAEPEAEVIVLDEFSVRNVDLKR